MDWTTVLVSVGGSVVIALLSYLGVRATSRASSAAAAEATQTENRRIDIEEFREIRQALNQRIDQLVERIEHLESELAAERSWRAVAVRYMRSLLRLLHEHAPHVEVPEPPAELDLTLTYRPRTIEPD